MTRPASSSDTLLLRLPPGVKVILAREAAAAGLTISEYVARLCWRRHRLEVDAEDGRKRKVRP